jgi:hypothetical protein
VAQAGTDLRSASLPQNGMGEKKPVRLVSVGLANKTALIA